MKIEIIEYNGAYWWISKESNDASGIEFETKEEALIDAKKRLGNIIVINQEVINDKGIFA